MSHNDSGDVEVSDTVYLRCSCCQVLVEHLCHAMPKPEEVQIVTKRRKNFQKITASEATSSAGSDEQNRPESDTEAEPDELPAKRRRKSNPRYDSNFVEGSLRGSSKKPKPTMPPKEASIEEDWGVVEVEISQDVDARSEGGISGAETLFMINEDAEDFEDEVSETATVKKKQTKDKKTAQKLFKSAADYLLELSDPHCVVAEDGENIECTACNRLISRVHFPEKRHRIDNLRSHCQSQSHKAKARLVKPPTGNSRNGESKAKTVFERKIYRYDSPYFWNQANDICICCGVRVGTRDEWKIHCHSEGHKDRFTSLKASPAFATFAKKQGRSLSSGKASGKKTDSWKQKKRTFLKPGRAVSRVTSTISRRKQSKPSKRV